MTFRQLALSNIRGSALRYAAFFLSSVFSVTLFFLYAQFLMHPDLAEGYLYGGDGTRVVLTVCAVLVGVFSFFFVLYSSGAFLRVRNREFGLLTLMGTTRGQLRRLIWLENTFLSVAAIAVGIGLGQLLSKLFLMGISSVLGLDTPIRFMLVPGAMLMTAAGFFVLFQLVTVVSSLRIGRQSVVELMRAARRPRTVPRASIWLALLGALLVAAGYVAALSVEGAGVVLAFVPVVAVVVVGTYLLFSQGSVKLLQWLQRAEASYLRGPRLLVVSQLLFRVRDNSRLLATIASLSAVVLAAAGTFYILTQQLNEGMSLAFPQELAFVERQGGDQPVTHAVVDGLLARHGVTPTARVSATVHELRFTDAGGRGGWLALLGEGDYAALAELAGLAPLDSLERVPLTYGAGAVRLWQQDEAEAYEPDRSGQSDQLGPVEARLLLPAPMRPVILDGDWYVVPDELLRGLPTDGREYAPATYWLYDWRAASGRAALEAELYSLALSSETLDVASRVVIDRMMRETFGLSMFAGVFVSLLFFIGAGSLIYFKLFTELEGDRRLFERLRRIGITPAETSRTVTAQIALVFLLPFALGGLHAFVALNALGAMVFTNVLQYAAVVIGLFALVQFGFFLLTRWTYLRALRPAR